MLKWLCILLIIGAVGCGTKSSAVPSLPEPPAKPTVAEQVELIPNIVHEDTQVLGYIQFMENPNFPMVALQDKRTQVFYVVILDARNGKPTWSAVEDPMIFIAMHKDPALPADKIWVDEGFIENGVTSKKLVRWGGSAREALERMEVFAATK